jgi:hypothetical protein|nr:MAG TPA: hypothetical protein [Caudoviricetes sp.]
MEDIKVLLNIDVTGGNYCHVGLSKGYAVMIDNFSSDWNCMIIKYPCKHFDEDAFLDFIIWNQWKTEKIFNFHIDFENTTEDQMKVYTKRALKHIRL